MEKIFRFGGELFWTMVWVFIVLIIGFAILGWLNNRFNGNIVGNAASWVATHAEPQQ